MADAVRMGMKQHPAVTGSAARVRAAGAKIEQAAAGRLPQVTYTETFARSDNPVFVFGSLLTQRQFNESNFAINSLNRPDFVNNFQSLVTVDQAIYDARRTRTAMESARLGESISKEDQRLVELRVAASVARSYLGVLLARESEKAAAEAVKSAEADLERARAVRAAGMSTDADVLSIEVHLAASKEQQIRRRYDAQVAEAALNEAIGAPLDAKQDLKTRLEPLPGDAAATAPASSPAAPQRPEIRQADLGARLARNELSGARSGWLPTVGARFAFEADRQRFVNRGGANWLVAANLRWNLFDGFLTRARTREAQSQVEAAELRQREIASAASLQVKQASAGLESAKERLTLAAASVRMAEESLRIAKNRYDAGLATVTDLLRNETALVETRFRQLAAIHDVRLAAVMLDLANGTLTGDSDVLK